MNKAKAFNLPIFLMAGPAIVMVSGFILTAILGAIASGMTPISDPNSELFAEVPVFARLLNILAFILGAVGVVGMIAILPCFITGLVLFLKRRRG